MAAKKAAKKTAAKKTARKPNAAFMRAMQPWSVGKAPPNFLEPDEGRQRLQASFGEEKFTRLVALKDKYDPHNVFSLNANILPSAR